MKIVTNGCSCTFGHKGSVNSQAPNWVWPSRLNDMNDITNVVNLAVEGASNDRVVRTSIEYFETAKEIDDMDKTATGSCAPRTGSIANTRISLTEAVMEKVAGPKSSSIITKSSFTLDGP